MDFRRCVRPLEAGVHQASRHQLPPLLYTALERPELAIGELPGVIALEAIEQRLSRGIWFRLKPLENVEPHCLERKRPANHIFAPGS